MISDYAKVSVQSSVTCCDFLFIPIVSIQWPMVGRQAWCHILREKMFRLVHTYSARQLPLSTITQISPPMANEVKGIAWTEMVFHERSEFLGDLRMMPIKEDPAGVSPQCKCWGQVWENSDSSNGTGDHEWIK